VLKRGAKSRIGEHECVYCMYVGCRHGQHICQPSCDDRRPLRDGLIRDSRRRRRVRNDNGDTCNSIYYNPLRALDMFCREQAAGPTRRRDSDKRCYTSRSLFNILTDVCHFSDGSSYTIRISAFIKHLVFVTTCSAMTY